MTHGNKCFQNLLEIIWNFYVWKKKDRIISDSVLTERSRREFTSFLILDPLKPTKSVPNRSMVVVKKQLPK